MDLIISSLRVGPQPLEMEVCVALQSALRQIGYAAQGASSISDRLDPKFDPDAVFRSRGFSFELDSSTPRSRYDLGILSGRLGASVYPDRARFSYSFGSQVQQVFEKENNPLPLIFFLGVARCAVEIGDALQHGLSVHYDDSDPLTIPPSGSEESRMLPFLEICNETTIGFGSLESLSAKGVLDRIETIAANLEEDLEYKPPYSLSYKQSGQEVIVQHIREPILSLGRSGHGFHPDTSAFLEAFAAFEDPPRLVIMSYATPNPRSSVSEPQLALYFHLVFFITPSPDEQIYRMELFLVSQSRVNELEEQVPMLRQRISDRFL